MSEEAQTPPLVRTRSRGQVNSTLEMFANKYREHFPRRKVRYVYDPQHKPELSGVLGRQVKGYQIVTLGEIGLASTSEEEDKPVRVGDLVLMSIDAPTAKALAQDLSNAAEEQRRSISMSYREEIEKAAAEASKEGARTPMVPIGNAQVEYKTHEYDIDQERKE